MNDKNFQLALAHLLQIEGGYVNDTADKGGETKYGISQRAYPDLDIANLTRDQASAIYYRDYWIAARCDRLPGVLGFALFDAVVNHGIKSPTQMLQSELNVRRDGDNGPITQQAAHSSDHLKTLEGFLVQRADLYHALVMANSTQAKFYRGWLKRLFLLQAAIYIHKGELQ